ERGTPVRPAILYGVDTRAEAQIRRRTNELGREEGLAHCGALPTSQCAGPKITCGAENEPEVYARAPRAFMPGCYLDFRLTADHASAGKSPPLYSLRRQDWHREWADRAAPQLELPRLRRPGEAAGTVDAEVTALVPGLPAGIPVISGTIDAWTEAASVGATRPGDLMLMYGTTTFLVATTDEPLASRTMWPTSGLAEGTYTLSGGMATSGAITDWLRELTGEDGFTDLVAEAQRSEPGANG